MLAFEAVMKILKYILIGITLLLGLNLLTFYLFGKQSLRDRNVEEIIRTEIINEEQVKLEYYLISELNDTSSIIVDGKLYPTFIIGTEYENKLSRYIDSVDQWKEFTVDLESAELILGVNLDSIFISDPLNQYPSYDFIFRELTKAAADSILFLENSTGFSGTCDYYLEQFDCIVIGKYVFAFIEEFETLIPLYSHQQISLMLDGSHIHWEREEKLIWLFYKWIQIEWVDGNGLGGD